MARSRFVRPDTDTLTLSNGDVLIVRRRLTTGETRDKFDACCRNVEQEDGSIIATPQPLLIPRAQVAAYLVDWSLAGDDVPIRGLDLAARMAILDSLDPDDFLEMRDAVNAHERRIIAARDAEKKILSGSRDGDPISASPSVADGGSSGSGTSTPMITPSSLTS